jgi:hypothetical protein
MPEVNPAKVGPVGKLSVIDTIFNLRAVNFQFLMDAMLVV